MLEMNSRMHSASVKAEAKHSILKKDLEKAENENLRLSGSLEDANESLVESQMTCVREASRGDASEASLLDLRASKMEIEAKSATFEAKCSELEEALSLAVQLQSPRGAEGPLRPVANTPTANTPIANTPGNTPGSTGLHVVNLTIREGVVAKGSNGGVSSKKSNKKGRRGSLGGKTRLVHKPPIMSPWDPLQLTSHNFGRIKPPVEVQQNALIEDGSEGTCIPLLFLVAQTASKLSFSHNQYAPNPSSNPNSNLLRDRFGIDCFRGDSEIYVGTKSFLWQPSQP